MNNSASDNECGPEIWEPSFEERTKDEEMSTEARSDQLRRLFTATTEAEDYNVKFVVGEAGHEFVLNRLVCELSSPVLRKILQEQQPIANAYTLPNVSPTYFQILVDYMFLLSEWTLKNVNDACELIEVAEQFQLFGFQVKIFSQLQKFIHEPEFLEHTSIFKVYSTLKKYGRKNESCVDAALQYILQNADDLLEQDGFLHVSASDILEILDSDDLCVESELQVFKAVIRWGLHSLQTENRPYTPETVWEILTPVVYVVRFQHISTLEFQQYVQPLNMTEVVEHAISQRIHSNPRNYILNKWQVDSAMVPIIMKIKAEQFVSNFKLQMQIYNNHLINQKLEARDFKLQMQINKHHLLNQELEERVKAQAQELDSLKNSHAQEIKKRDESLLQIQTKLLLHEDEISEIWRTNFDKFFAGSLELGISFVIENNTSTVLKIQDNYFFCEDTSFFKEIPDEIIQEETTTFGFTHSTELAGLFAYQIHHQLFVLKYCTRADHNDIKIAFCPLNVGKGQQLFQLIRVEDWSSRTDRIRKLTTTNNTGKDKKLEVAIKLGKLKASATMKTGTKTLVHIVISES